jgi:hypothetical protein
MSALETTEDVLAITRDMDPAVDSSHFWGSDLAALPVAGPHGDAHPGPPPAHPRAMTPVSDGGGAGSESGGGANGPSPVPASSGGGMGSVVAGLVSSVLGRARAGSGSASALTSPSPDLPPRPPPVYRSQSVKGVARPEGGVGGGSAFVGHSGSGSIGGRVLSGGVAAVTLESFASSPAMITPRRASGTGAGGGSSPAPSPPVVVAAVDGGSGAGSDDTVDGAVVVGDSGGAAAPQLEITTPAGADCSLLDGVEHDVVDVVSDDEVSDDGGSPSRAVSASGDDPVKVSVPPMLNVSL